MSCLVGVERVSETCRRLAHLRVPPPQLRDRDGGQQQREASSADAGYDGGHNPHRPQPSAEAGDHEGDQRQDERQSDKWEDRAAQWPW